MAFTHALYYPWIDIEDIKNQEWLKTCLLYWDKLSTIVPDDPTNFHYKSQSAYFLQSLGILLPEFVEPNLHAVNEASNYFYSYMTTPEATDILLPPGSKMYRIPTLDQSKDLSMLRIEKLTTTLKNELIKSGRVIEDRGWLIVDRSALNYYMTLLASSICRRKNYSPVTDDESFEPLSNRFRRNDAPAGSRGRRAIVEGLLAKMTLESVGIAAETPFDDIVRFRDDHKDELGYFRTEIGKLAQEIDPETPTFDALQQQILDIYTNKVSPAMNTLRDALARARIRSVLTNLTSVLFTAAIPFLPKENYINILTSIGVQVAIHKINYDLERKEQLSENPYSYVLKVESHLS